MNTQASSMEADHHPCMDIKTYRRLAGRYSSVLERAKEYLSKKRKSRTGGSISASRKQALLEAGAECPMCGEAFREGSFNTEHIHSKCLGGLKSSDHNRIAMCIPCNDAKNWVMQRMLPQPKSKYQPSYWPMVEGYSLWSEVTADEGLAAGALIPEAHAYFLEARFADEPMLNHRVRRAFGRFSTWKAGHDPNFSCNLPEVLGLDSDPDSKPTPQLNQYQSPSSESVAWGKVLRKVARDFFDRLFDYSPADANVQGMSPSSSFEHGEALAQPLDTVEIYRRWRDVLDDAFEAGDGSVELRLFWEMVVEERLKTNYSWKAFEREFGVHPKRTMPMKATHYLTEMKYNFTFQRGVGGYDIVLLSEEE